MEVLVLVLTKKVLFTSLGLSAPQFYGFPSIYAYTYLCRTTTKFHTVTHIGEERSATPPILRERSYSAAQFWSSPVFMYTFLNAERPAKFGVGTIAHVGRGVFEGGQSRHCVCTLCVARFVSDS